MTGRRWLLDLRPLQVSADFRRIWLGQLASMLGSQMTAYAVALQVFRITRSSAAVGGLGLVAAAVSVTVGLAGGVVIDIVDRRRLVMLTRSLAAVVSALFAVQAFAGVHRVSVLYVLEGMQFALTSVGAPAARTFMPRLLPKELIPAGAAVNGFSFQLALVVGPLIAGVLTASFGLKVCYVVDAVSFFAGLYAAFRLPAMRPESASSTMTVSAFRDGVRFLGRTTAVKGALVSDLAATSLGMPVALFPAIDLARFHGSPQDLGYMTAALAIGGVLASAFSGPVSHIGHHGRAMLTCVAVWGAAVSAFGAVGGSWATFGCLAVAGFADMLSVVFRTSMVQTATPDTLRGRVSAVEFVVGAGAPQLGNFRGGLLAAATTPGVSATIGGLSSIAGAGVIALAMPAYLAYEARAG